MFVVFKLLNKYDTDFSTENTSLYRRCVNVDELKSEFGYISKYSLMLSGWCFIGDNDFVLIDVNSPKTKTMGIKSIIRDILLEDLI